MDGFDLAESGDDSLRALNYILEAWEEGTSSGIQPELLAYAALFTALSDLVASYGEEAVAKLTAGLGVRIQSGEFSLGRRTQ